MWKGRNKVNWKLAKDNYVFCDCKGLTNYEGQKYKTSMTNKNMEVKSKYSMSFESSHCNNNAESTRMPSKLKLKNLSKFEYITKWCSKRKTN